MLGENLSFAASEAYKLLRTNLDFALSDEQKCRIIGMTSSVRGEGKSTTTLNLAYSIAEAGKLVLVIEADMRMPTYTKRLHMLNRDTMTKIQILGVRGDVAGTFTGQLALAHTYGSGERDSCLNTTEAVSNLLYGVGIDHYISITMDGVAILNDLVGGVEVEVMDDFSSIDSTLVQGETVTLMGNHALTYVRTRGGLEDSSNLHRMERQRQYLIALQKKLTEKANSDAWFATNAILQVSDYLTSDCTAEKLSKIADLLSKSDVSEIRTIDGEAKVGQEYMEFYPDEDALQALVMNVFYEKVKK